jgi:hypothetical protein
MSERSCRGFAAATGAERTGLYMRIANTIKIASAMLAGMVVYGCGSDPNQPATLKEQQAAMHPAPPSADQLKEAMSKVHFRTPDSGPPGGQMPPPGTKVGK